MFGIIFSFVASQILYFALHLESSSFPKPLSARDEIAAFEAMKNGDMAARDKLIRHNLRRVAFSRAVESPARRAANVSISSLAVNGRGKLPASR